MEHWTKKLLPLLIIVGLVLALGACGPTEEPAVEPTEAVAEPTEAAAEPMPEADKVFKLGILGPFSGPSARTGDEFKASATMALPDRAGVDRLPV
jgi:hypothetical protein